MARVLVIAPGPRGSADPALLSSPRVQVELISDLRPALQLAATHVYDLLVLANMTVDEQQQVASRFQQHRRWRLVPILYVQPAESGGIIFPAGYRPDVDSLARGDVRSPAVQRRMQSMARDGVAAAEVVVAGAFELDPLNNILRIGPAEVALTEREAEVLGMLLSQPNRTVTAGEIIERGWGGGPDERSLQILRRHVSNIRRKLEKTPASRSVRTVRGSGYRFDVRRAS